MYNYLSVGVKIFQDDVNFNNSRLHIDLLSKA